MLSRVPCVTSGACIVEAPGPNSQYQNGPRSGETIHKREAVGGGHKVGAARCPAGGFERPVRQEVGGNSGSRFTKEAERVLKWVVKTLRYFGPELFVTPPGPRDLITNQAKTNSPRCSARACSRSRRPSRPLTCRNTAP